MRIELNNNGQIQRTWFKSLSHVKRWATRYKHVYHMDGEVLVVSTAEGLIYRYREIRPGTRDVK